MAPKDDRRERELGQQARPARNMVVEMLTQLRSVLNDDRLYARVLHQVEGWCFGQRSWLEAVAKQEDAEKLKEDVAKVIMKPIPLPLIKEDQE